ncbi:FAD-dependent oxidoreductase domain-containing protein 1-like [Ornithodoros turicata]|uniref:FAD-dependent oxidoreductase domain-containing protein 1-like n=1 Tax=Ornithodoros turicata TaxID=34597 RepID=UPI00313896CC
MMLPFLNMWGCRVPTRVSLRLLSVTSLKCSSKDSKDDDSTTPHDEFDGKPTIGTPGISPGRKVFNIFKEEFKGYLKPRSKDIPEPPFPKEVDILVVGGGIMGSSIAYWLKQRAPESFTLNVLERDLTYTRASSVLSVGGIRQQFSLPENIQLSMFSAEFLRNVKKNLSVLDFDPPDIQFQPHGYLFLASENGVQPMQENHAMQESLGARVELLKPDKLKQKFPWLNTEGIALASHGLDNEGWFDPWSLLTAFRRKAVSLGARYLNAELVGFKIPQVPPDVAMHGPDSYRPVNHAYVKLPNGETQELQFAILIVAAGPHSAEVARMLRIGGGDGLLERPLPVEPRKRYVYVFHCGDGPGFNFPLVVGPDGVYCRREGMAGHYVCGKSPLEQEEPDIGDLDVDYSFFDKAVWPSLAERIPAFESIKIRSAWAGFYDYNTLDQNALVGRHPYYNNVYFATGFSGHGIQMAPGVGRAIMEIILDGKYVTIDLERFGLDRIVHNDPVLERQIV